MSGGRQGKRVGVDALLPRDWSAAKPGGDAVANLARWSQGHAVRGAAILFAGARADRVTGVDAEDHWRAIDATPDHEWSIVVSQTCDIGATGPGARHPFVMCAPLICLDDRPDNFRQSVHQYQVTYLAPITNSPDPMGSGTDWAADLRLFVPVSKSVLIASDPVDVFDTDRTRVLFAEHVARKTLRPALADVLSEDLKRLLDGVIQNVPKDISSDWCDNVEQIRIAVDDRLAPSWVRVHVVILNGQRLERADKAR